MNTADYWGFCALAIALALVPGPTVTVIIANSLRYGVRAGLSNVLGTQAGFILWLIIATLGLGAAVTMMGHWFDMLRYAGAAYLIWLGFKMLRARGQLAFASEPDNHRSFFLQGFLVIITNPKMLVLFGTMIPPFLRSPEHVMRDTFILGLTFMIIAAIGDTAYAFLAHGARVWLSQSRVRGVEVVSGLFLMAGGLWLALKSR